MTPDLNSELMDLVGKAVESNPNEPSKAKSANLMQPARDVWRVHSEEHLNAFDKGVLVSNYNTVARTELDSILGGILRLVEEVMRDQLARKEHSSEDLVNLFKALVHISKALSENVSNKLLSKKQTIDYSILLAALNGFVNSHAERHSK